MLRILKVALSALVLCSLGSGLMAQSAPGPAPELINSFRDWDAYIRYEGGSKICYMVTVPTEKLPASVRHGDVMLMVVHIPGKKRWDEVMLSTGYAHQEGSEVVLSIGETEEEMFTSNDSAWLWDSATDKKVVAAMRRGSFMVSKGKSQRGTVVEYHYSLSGVTAAHRAINRACNR